MVEESGPDEGDVPMSSESKGELTTSDQVEVGDINVCSAKDS